MQNYSPDSMELYEELTYHNIHSTNQNILTVIFRHNTDPLKNVFTEIQYNALLWYFS